MAKSSFRLERINETIKQVLSELLVSEIKDPRVGMVTITEVRVSSDLSSAKVYFSVLGEASGREKTARGLKSARNFMRTAVANALKVHNAPELHFVYDDTLDRSFAVEEEIRKIRKEKEGGGEEPGPEE